MSTHKSCGASKVTPLWLPGVVKSLADPDGLGRVQVHFPQLGGDNRSFWASIAAPMAGNKRGVSNSRRVAAGNKRAALGARGVVSEAWLVGPGPGWHPDRAEDAYRADIRTAGQLYCWHRTHGALHDQTFIRA